MKNHGVNKWIKSWLCVAMCLFPCAICVAGVSDRNPASPFVLKFYVALIEGRDCSRLFDLRNEANGQGADHIQQQIMQERLISVGCFQRTSTRAPSTQAVVDK